jgi:hypothetical protein
MWCHNKQKLIIDIEGLNYQFFFWPKGFSMDNADNKGLPSGGVAALH